MKIRIKATAVGDDGREVETEILLTPDYAMRGIHIPEGKTIAGNLDETWEVCFLAPEGFR